MFKTLDTIPLHFFIIMCLLLGLAPFQPEPHVVQKIKMLMSGELSKAIDIFDLIMHGAPWILLLIKISRYFISKPSQA